VFHPLPGDHGRLATFILVMKVKRIWFASYCVLMLAVVFEAALIVLGWKHWTSIIGAAGVTWVFIYSMDQLNDD
jgi:hypothetical protein